MTKAFSVFLLIVCAILSAGFLFEPKVPFKKTTGGGGGSLIMPAYNNLSTNWQNAGLAKIGGIPTRNTQCGSTINPTGVTPPASNDDAHTINTAITNCTSGQVVQLGSGVFQLDNSESIQVTNSITLRGTGSCNGSSTPYCATVINNYNGAWPEFTGTNCGTSTGVPPSGTPPSSFSTCPNNGPMIIVGASGCSNCLGWGENNSNNCQIFNSNPTTQGCGTLIAADVAQGATTVQVADNSNFSVGTWALIDESSQFQTGVTNPVGNGQPSLSATPDWLNTTATPITMRAMFNGTGSQTYTFCCDRIAAEIHVVSAVGAGPCPGVNCTVTFDDPLTMSYHQSNSHDARLYWPTAYNFSQSMPFLQQGGVENLSITRATNVPLQFLYCAYCWAKNIEAAYWIGGTTVAYAARSQITGSYFHNCVDCTNDGREYPIAIDAASTEVLFDNNITEKAGKGMVGRASNTAVIAYNYVDHSFYQNSAIGDWLVDMLVNGSHYAGTHHWLLEGNWGPNCDGDETHGSESYHVFFRNDCTGLRSDFTNPETGLTVSDTNNTCHNGSGHVDCGPLRTAGPMAYNYWYAYLDNVLGLAGTTTTGNGWVYFNYNPSNSQVNKSIWLTGFCNSAESDCNAGGSNAYADLNLYGTAQNVLNNSFIFRNGNYDYVNAAVMDNAAGYSQTFPNSLYASSKPAFFSAGSCTYPWPWVTPTSSPFVQPNTGGAGCGGSGLPAKARYDAGTPFVQP